MVGNYRIECGYDEALVAYFMKLLHERDSVEGRFRPFDFTLTTFWGDAAEKADTATPHRYVLLRNGDPIGLFQGLIDKTLFYRDLHAGSTSGNCIILLPGFSQETMRNFFVKVVAQLKVQGVFAFVPVSLGIPGFSERRNYTFYVDLSLNLDDIFRNMDKKTRNRVRKAEKTGVAVRFSNSLKGLETSYQLINLTSSQKSLFGPTWRYTTELHQCFQGHGRESFVALSYAGDEKVVSVAHLLGFDRKLVLWQVGSTEQGYKLNAGSLVQAQIISWAKDRGYLIYDMGGTNPYISLYAGIHRFKSGFGGELITNLVLEKTPFYVPLYRRFRKLSEKMRLMLP